MYQTLFTVFIYLKAFWIKNALETMFGLSVIGLLSYIEYYYMYLNIIYSSVTLLETTVYSIPIIPDVSRNLSFRDVQTWA